MKGLRRFGTMLLIGMLLALVFTLGAPLFESHGTASAQGTATPSDCQYAVAGYTGMGPEQVAVSQQAFDTKIGFAWNLTTEAQWKQTYASRCNLYGHSVGLTFNVLTEDGWTNSGILTSSGKVWSDIGKLEYPSTVTVAGK